MRQEPIETIKYRGIDIQIFQDDDTENPRNWDNLGHMICWHRSYDLGDKHEFSDPDEFKEFVEKEMKEKVIWMPLFLYDHSGITMSTGRFSCPWDSGQVGYIYLTHEEAKKEYGWKNLSPNRIKQIEEYLVLEVKTYDQYLTGDTYGFNIESPVNDSCWGFFGHDWVNNGLFDHAKPSIDWYIKNRRTEHYQQVKTWIRNKVPLLYRKPLDEFVCN